jgi:hypothetical protein
MNSINNLKFVDGNFINSNDFTDMIYDNEGSFTEKEQSMSFDANDKEIIVNYELYVSGSINEESGDYWTPGSCEVDVTEVDVTISEVFIDGLLTDLQSQELEVIEKLIKLQLS